MFDKSCDDCISERRLFSKLILLKSYMHTIMTQQKLNDLATIAFESEMLRKTDYDNIIEDFILKKTKNDAVQINRYGCQYISLVPVKYYVIYIKIIYRFKFSYKIGPILDFRTRPRILPAQP